MPGSANQALVSKPLRISDTASVLGAARVRDERSDWGRVGRRRFIEISGLVVERMRFAYRPNQSK